MHFETLGRYRVRGEIGRGSMGVVYRGHDPVIDRPIALKTVVFPEALSAEERRAYLERFFMEARTAGKLLHSNIVVIYDAATDEATGTPFIAMELVEGEPLSVRLQREGALAWSEALGIAAAVAEALDHAHRAGVVHRDIKPANVMLDRNGVPKIADFGIAKLPTAKLTQTGVVVGTPYFMSPEQLRGEELDGRSDLFSLGAMLHNLVSGSPPFEGTELATIASQILYKSPRTLVESGRQVPRELDDVLARALAKRAEERYQSGAELAEDLRAVRGHGPPIHAAPVPARDEAPATLVSRAVADAPSAPVSSAAPASPLSRIPRWLAAALLLLVLVPSAAFYFRDEIGEWALYSDAKGSFEKGDLEKSESTLEELLARNPDLDEASELLSRVSADLVRPELPIELGARHRHRIGSCTGTLVLSEGALEFRSSKHPLWRWDFGHLRVLARQPGGIRLETNETQMMGLLESKNYNFDLLGAGLQDRTWRRFVRAAGLE